jgi:hypothetical protein
MSAAKDLRKKCGEDYVSNQYSLLTVFCLPWIAGYPVSEQAYTQNGFKSAQNSSIACSEYL